MSVLSFKECFIFPVSTREGRKDVLIGSLLLFTLIFGWILNLGRRLDVVYRIYHQQEPVFVGFSPWRKTFKRGLFAAVAIGFYLLPSIIFGVLAFFQNETLPMTICWGIASCLFLLSIYSLPGGMTHNAAFNDMSYLWRPDKAFIKAVDGGWLYNKAWLIALSAIGLSFTGLLFFGVGFFYTSVWAWQVVGFAFSKALVLNNLKT